MTPEPINHSDLFAEVGLKNVDESLFSSRNLIIGANGSGKTRFLKIPEHIKTTEGDVSDKNVVTLYFPEIHSYYEQLKDSPPPKEFISIYDFLCGEEKLSFLDFLKTVENDRARFINDFKHGLSMNGLRRQETNTIINNLQEKIALFLPDKRIQIDFEAHQYSICLVEKTSGRKIDLGEALNEFSPGELILFYLAIFLTVITGPKYKHLVLILDEPTPGDTKKSNKKCNPHEYPKCSGTFDAEL